MKSKLSGNILVLTYWSLDDALVQSATIPYLKMIRKSLDPSKKIWLNTLESKKPEKLNEKHQEMEALGLHWFPTRFFKYGIFSYLGNLSLLLNFIFFCYTKRISVIHIFGTPPGIQGYLLSIFTGAKMVLDSYEPHAETMVENGTWRKNGLRHELLFYFEKKITQKASAAIAVATHMDDYSKERYGFTFKDNYFVRPSCVDLELFSLQKKKSETLLNELGLKNKIVGVYAGKFGGIYLGYETFELIKVLDKHFKGNFKMLLLTSHKREEIEKYCKITGANMDNIVLKFVKYTDVPEYIGLADFAITPVKPVYSKKFCSPIKDGEYWALGLPVIIPKDISDDSDIIETEDIGAVLQDLTLAEYKNAAEKIEKLIASDNGQLTNKIRQIAEKYRNFAIAEKVYSAIYY